MTDQNRQEWSRHYDTIQWVIVGLVLAGAGALLIASLDKKAEWWPDALGAPLTTIGLFYVAGFRYFRARFHATIEDKELRSMLEDLGPPGLPHQWPVFVCILSAIGAVFVCRLSYKVLPAYTVWLTALGWIVMGVLHGIILHYGKSEGR